MTFKRGSLVSYGGRAAEVQGVQPFTLPSGRSIDCLVLLYTAQPRGIARIPVERVADNVQRITAKQAAAMDANPVSPVFRILSKAQRAKSEAERLQRQADFGRNGGLTKARNRKRAA